MWKYIKLKNGKADTVQSYLGFLKNGNTKKITDEISNRYVNS
ncbi:MAG: hypothetical protein U9R00_03030 [Patescibacteria group bacterium]|nr:hypothetical protein [Patescibacteria group bacterium]